MDRLLLVETSSHFSVFKHLCRMLSNIFKVDGYFPYNKRDYLDRHTGYVKYFKFHSVFIYYALILKGFSYDLIYLSTGPQYVIRKNGWVVLIGYALFILIHGDKTILQVRDNSFYFNNRYPNIIDYIYQKIRYLSTFKVRLLAFEFKNQKRDFLIQFPFFDNKCFVSYVYYSDIDFLDSDRPEKLDQKFRIGLLGSIDPDRRDYEILIHALKLISIETRLNFSLVSLGYSAPEIADNIVRDISDLIDFEHTDGLIDDARLAELSSTCSVFLSPLRKDRRYGIAKGSGSYGDAVRFRKMLVIPSFSDPSGEFASFCYYYDDPVSLARLLEYLQCNGLPDVYDIFSSFSSVEVSFGLSSKLNLRDL